MLRWRRREKQAGPLWRVWYGIPTNDTASPEWVEWLNSQEKGMEAEFFLRSEAPQWIFDGTFGGVEVQPLLKKCRGVATLSTQYEEHPKPRWRGKAYLQIIKLAHSLAQREAGVAVNLLAYRFYNTVEWKDKLDRFRIGDHYSIHEITREKQQAGLWVHSHGLIQFALPEVEIQAVPEELVDRASEFIEFITLVMLHGEEYGDGHTLAAPDDPEIWAMCESIPAAEDEAHADLAYPVLRFSDYDRETGEIKTGLTRYLRASEKGFTGE